jgi:hypothetical protein
MTIRITAGRERPPTVLLEDYETPWADYRGAVAEDAWNWNPVQAGRRLHELRLAERGMLQDGMVVGSWFDPPPEPRRLSAEEANERYGGLGLTWDREVAEPVAELLAERKREENARQDLLQRGSTGIGRKAAALGIGLLVSMADPLNVVSAFVPVVGEARYALWAQRMGRTHARLARGAIEGAAGAAMIEPFLLGVSRQEQADYSLMDSLLNVAFGTVLGGGLHAVAGAVGDGVRRGSAAEQVRTMLAREQEELQRLAIAQMSTGAGVDVAPFARALARSDELTADFDAFLRGEGRAMAVADDPLTPAPPGGRSLADAPEADWELGPPSAGGRYEQYRVAPGDRRWIEGVVAELDQAWDGHKVFNEVDGQGSTPEVIGVKGNMPAWFRRHNEQARTLSRQRQRDAAAGRRGGAAPVMLTRERVRQVAGKLVAGAPLNRGEGDVALAVMGAAREARARNAREMLDGRRAREERREVEWDAFWRRESEGDGVADPEASAAFDDLVEVAAPTPRPRRADGGAEAAAEMEAAEVALADLRANGLLDEGDEALLREADAMIASAEDWGRGAEAAAFCMARTA